MKVVSSTRTRHPHPTPEAGRLRRFLSAHPLAVDLGFTVALGLLAVRPLMAEAEHRGVAVVLNLGLLVPLVWRRGYPMAAFTVITAVAFVQLVLDVRGPGDIALLVAFYTIAATGSRPRTLAAAAVLELGVVAATIRWAGPSYEDRLAALVFLSGLATAAGVSGINVGTRRAHLAALEDRAARLERERDQQTRLAAAAERARIAREMHDIIAHSLSVMIALADGATFALETSPGQAAVAMASVSGTGRHALAEMRRLLGVLRGDQPDAGRAPVPGIGDLDDLIGQVRAAGLPVTVEISGHRGFFSAGAQLTVFRIVQEALTNSLKHGGTAVTARVVLRYDTVGVDMMITDTGTGSDPPRPGGQGLVGMRERVAVYGGTVDVGPCLGGGWQVMARVHRDGETVGA